MEERYTKLPIKARLFCYYYLKLGNIREAAVRAGYFPPVALPEGAKLLERADVRAFLEHLSGSLGKTRAELIKQGLERLAFGSACDAISLACAEEPPGRMEIEGMDLFAISEFKRIKGGGVEVKLFDRQKALALLWELEHTAETSATAQSFYDALRAGASSIEGKEEGEASPGER